MKVQYTGTSDVRELGAADLAKVGVDGFRKTSFAQGDVVEVSDEAGTALVNEGLFDGEFTEVKEAAVEGDADAEAKAAADRVEADKLAQAAKSGADGASAQQTEAPSTGSTPSAGGRSSSRTTT